MTSMNDFILGIDLGTTYSSVSLMMSNEVKIIEDKNEYRIPSIVHFSKQTDSDELNYEVGKNASNYLSRDPKMTIYDSKRMLGHHFDDPEIQQLIPIWPFDIEEDKNNGEILISLDEINEKIEPYKVSGYILKYLAEIGNRVLDGDQKTSKVIITIPANFGDEQREDTKRAASFAGLNLLNMINEPTSAGISYGMSRKYSDLSKVIIFDFGGGTLDVSLLEIKDDFFNVIDTDGDMFLGGRNFDENVVNFLIAKHKLESSRNNPKRMKVLREKAKLIKENLSYSPKALYEFSNGDDEIEDEMTLEQFEDANKELIDKILVPVENLLKRRDLNIDDIAHVVLVGGSSNMKFVKRKLTDYFGEEPFFDINSGTAVARGAAFVASHYNEDDKLSDSTDKVENEKDGNIVDTTEEVGENDDNDDDKKVKEIDDDKKESCIYKTFKYHDICAFSIGIYCITENGKKFLPIIKRGSQIPTHEEEKFATIYYRQKRFVVHIFQGNSENIEDDHYLGFFEVDDLPVSEDPIDFELRFDLSKEGILSAQAKIINNSELSKGTILKVHKIKRGLSAANHNFKNDSDKYWDRKLFLINLKLFIEENRKQIEKACGKSQVERVLIKIERFEEKPDDEDEYPENMDITSFTAIFNNMLNNYLKKLGVIPAFIRKYRD